MCLPHGWPADCALCVHPVRRYKGVIEAKESARHWQLASKIPGKGTIMNVARTLNNWRKYRQTVAELGRMSPRELSDLGIAQGDIRRIARQAVGF